MKPALCIGTTHGLFVFERTQQGWRERSGELSGRQFTSVARRNEALLAGTVDGIFRSDDFGQTWWESNEGLTERHIRWLAYHPEEGGPAFAGMEPAAIFISHDGGETWHECPEVATLRDENDWSLPYSPEAGCVRGFAFKDARGYAAVEQGGLLRSDNRGESWHLAEGSTGKPDAAIPESFIHPDVHSVQIRPGSADQVFAPTGGGLYQSVDGGKHWTHLYRCYCRAIWLDPADPGHLIFGPADGVDTNGRIEESIDGGETWEPAMNGLEERWPGHMVERFSQVGDELIAVLSNGEMIAAPLDTLDWRRIVPAIQGVNAAAPIMI
jgi:photosystem II stability/assembly factor-like uncharacterized protein